MTILSGDIVLAASQTMDDVPEGGGAPVATIIVDNSSNGIFNDISELDRAGGRVNLRKVFASVRTNNTDGYFGANMIVADPPKDPNVSVTLFSTNDSFDQRVDAQSRIESYLAQGPLSSAYLFGDHIAGQGAITLLQRDGLALPVVGDSFVLRKNEGLTTQVEQFVRVTKVSTIERVFTDAQGDFQRLEMTLTISDVLLDDYPGFGAIRQDSAINFGTQTKVYTTIVADAARYFGVRPMVDAAVIGDFTVSADTIFTQIVPSTRVETPIADARMNQQATALVAAASGPLTQSFTLAFTTTQQLFVGGGILPGSLSIVRSGITVTDKGGTLQGPAGQVGIVDYDNGILTLTTNVFGTAPGAHTITYLPATTPIVVTESVGIPVTVQGQRLTYVVPLAPIPARSTLQVSFRAQNQWSVLSDDGSGAIRGSNSSVGAGSLNFTTGTVTLTLGALPDVGSQIIFQWAPEVVSQPIGSASAAGITPFEKIIQLQNAIKPGTLSITWNDGTPRTSTDSGGLLGGDGSGVVDYAKGIISLAPDLLPPVGTSISVTVGSSVQVKSSVGAMIDAGTNWTFTLPPPVKARGLRLAITASYPLRQYPGIDAPTLLYVSVFDDGQGNLVTFSPFGNNSNAVGIINYATGACSINKSIPTGYLTLQPTFATIVVQTATLGAGGVPAQPEITKIAQTGFANRNTPLSFVNAVDPSMVLPNFAWWTVNANVVEAIYASTDITGGPFPFTFDQLFMSSGDVNITGFTLGTHTVNFDGPSATYQQDQSPTTGQGARIGVRSIVNGNAGVLLSAWPAGPSSQPTGLNGIKVSAVNGQLGEGVTFRTAISPLFNGGFTINWSRPNQQDPTLPPDQFSATADVNGVINSNGVVGRIDYDSGVCTLRFGTIVTGNPNSTTQDVTYLEIQGVTEINPQGIAADSLRYSAVGFTFLPLDANILGLNPVRLPPDGRVPIFRPGSFAVVGNTQTIAAATYVNGNNVDCGRVRLSRVRVIGSDNVVINVGYTADLEAGIVSISDVSTWHQPVTIEHRIEDMSVVSDAQISGQITFTAPLTHNYPSTGSFVSSALVAGDMRARVSLVFDQQTFTNVFSDNPIGNPATGSFDTISHPITITNAGGLTERWALVFTSTTAFNIIGEHVGVIGTGTTNSDSSPLNPATQQPYFTVPALGWGLGWVPGNVLRFNTVGAEFPIWVIRTIQQGPPTIDDDSFQIVIRGDVNNP
jgi:hypothetical protein